MTPLKLLMGFHAICRNEVISDVNVVIIVKSVQVVADSTIYATVAELVKVSIQ